MKIEKGKLYYNTQEGILEMPMSDMEVDEGVLTGKIAVRCKNEDDWKYVKKIYSNLRICNSMEHNAQKWDGDVLISLYGEGGYCTEGYYLNEGYYIIDIQAFKEFYPEQDKELRAEYQNRGAILRTHTPLVNADEFDRNSEEELKEDEEILRRSEERAIEQDNINPHHYNSKGIQPIEYIEANNMNFNEGNVIKYITRYKEKNGLEDLKKAKVYLQRLIDRYEN